MDYLQEENQKLKKERVIISEDLKIFKENNHRSLDTITDELKRKNQILTQLEDKVS
jgi:hypothetical protein